MVASPAGNQFAVVQVVAVQGNVQRRALQHGVGDTGQGEAAMDIDLLRHHQEIVVNAQYRYPRHLDGSGGIDHGCQWAADDLFYFRVQVVVVQGDAIVFSEYASAET